MARRRLAPVDPLSVPRAEHLRAPGFPAPIARVTADAVDAASSAELAETLTRARETGRLILDLPLAAVAADHLTRDRLPDDPEMDALRASVRAHGQRTPIEVTPLTGALPYGLISGWRRLMALKSLHAETGEDRFATVQALVRRPDTAADAYITMVEENEIRLGLSHYERARVAALAAARGVFEDEEAALKALFGTASRPKRSRIRGFLELYHALDGVLRFPAQLPERLGLALIERVRAGQGPRIAAALAAADPQTPEAERKTLAALAHPRPDRARPAEILPGVTLEEDLRGRTLTLRLKGVTPELAAAVRAALSRLA